LEECEAEIIDPEKREGEDGSDDGEGGDDSGGSKGQDEDDGCEI